MTLPKKKKTTWTPEPCDGLKSIMVIDKGTGLPVQQMVPDKCKIEIEGDWENPISVTSVQKCAVHAHLPDGEPHFISVWKEENQILSYTFGIAQDEEPTLVKENYIWEFDAQRKLKVNFKGVNTIKKNAIQAACNSRFGAGKVSVNPAVMEE